MKALCVLVSTVIGLLCVLPECGGKDSSRRTEKPDFLAANLDETVSAGDDFFQDANGGWFKRNPIPATEPAWGTAYLLDKQVAEALRAINSSAAATAICAIPWLTTTE